jgi:SAM-dependent methyltransferase
MARADAVEQPAPAVPALPAVLAMLGDPAGRRILYAGTHPERTGRALAEGRANVTALVGAGTRLDDIDVVPLRAELADVHFQPVYDAVVAEGVFGMTEDWEAALRTAVHALRPDGQLVFVVEHPARSGRDGYLAVYPVDAQGIHRPLSTYLNAVVRAGCRIEEIAEPGMILVVSARRNR